jgi:predicted nucleotidyltransferase component of viral defense system
VIPRPYITQWSWQAPWPREHQIEQDLILSRLIVEIGRHELLGREIAFRGGTCLHKLHMDKPARYSEDLDYTRTSQEPKIGECMAALRGIAAEIGLSERRRRFPSGDSDMACIWFGASAETEDERRLSIKIEINVQESTPYRPHILVPYGVESRWWSGEAEVRTFELEEVLSTKLRALYARRKGRDLFDLWFALRQVELDDRAVVEGLEHYMGDGVYSYRQLQRNLSGKLGDAVFLEDITNLTRDVGSYDAAEAGAIVMGRLGVHLRNGPVEG